MGDIKAWSDRITQGIAMLKENAIKGYIRYMPPKKVAMIYRMLELKQK